MTGFCFQLSSTGDVSDVLDSKAATVDCFSSRLVDEILHNIYSGLSLALKSPH